MRVPSIHYHPDPPPPIGGGSQASTESASQKPSINLKTVTLDPTYKHIKTELVEGTDSIYVVSFLVNKIEDTDVEIKKLKRELGNLIMPEYKVNKVILNFENVETLPDNAVQAINSFRGMCVGGQPLRLCNINSSMTSQFKQVNEKFKSLIYTDLESALKDF